MPQANKIAFRVWIEVGSTRFLGIGRVQLLEHIIETGSISKAAKKMGLSYRKAWQLVKSMNELGRKPLVEKHPGGKSGGGASVTPAGRSAIRKYHLLQKRIEHAITNAEIPA